MPTVLITCPVFTTRDDAPMRTLRSAGWDVRHVPDGTHASEDRLISLLDGVDATVAGAEPYSRRVLEAAPRLKHVARWGVGFDRVDLDAATDAGVLVTTTQGANDWGVADHAFALILGLGHMIADNHDLVRRSGWGRPIGSDVWRKTLGVVGLGRIGRGVAQRAYGFEMRVLAYEPFPDQAFCATWNVEVVPLDQLLREADYVTLHVPASPETRRFMNRDRLALMKPTAFLVNTARGTLVDEDALFDALASGRIAGAGLDVREKEPPTDKRFDDLPNVILSPHVAGVTHETVAAMSGMAVESILTGARGERPHGLLNPAVWDRRRPY